MFAGDGVGRSDRQRLRQLFSDRQMSFVEVEDLMCVESLHAFRAIVVPGGYPMQQWKSLGTHAGAERIRDFVHNGGGYIGLCAGACLGGAISTNQSSVGIGLLPVRCVSSVWKAKEDMKAKIEVKAGDFHDSNAVFEDGSETVSIRYRNGPLFPEGKTLKKQGIEVVASVVDCTQLPKPCRSKIHRKPCIIQGTYGRGRVLLCGPHPEHTDGLEDFTWKLFERVLM